MFTSHRTGERGLPLSPNSLHPARRRHRHRVLLWRGSRSEGRVQVPHLPKRRVGPSHADQLPTHRRSAMPANLCLLFVPDAHVIKSDHILISSTPFFFFVPSEKEQSSALGTPALPIVISTASSVAFILLLVVLFVLVQPKLKSFHHNR